MTVPSDPFTLADWRRHVAEIYAAARLNRTAEGAWLNYRTGRESLFKHHPQSPLSSEQRRRFTTLPYYPYDSAWRVVGTIDTNVEREVFQVLLPSDGEFRYTRVAQIRFEVGGKAGSLSVFWIEGYGGGLFLPFKDRTSGQTTYGGGRYLYDSIKGADLSLTADEMILDFNFAYNPSCAYNDQWVCPLSPLENQLPFAVEAGEQAFLDKQV